MQLGDVWLTNVQQTWTVETPKVHAVRGYTDGAALQGALPAFMEDTRDCARRGRFNADVRILFFKLTSDAILAMCRPAGSKEKKDCVTVLICAKLDGSEKVLSLFIGSALRSRAS